MRTLTGIDDLETLVGQHLGTSEWVDITQERIDAFAEATGDHQWIHVDPERAKAGPFGAPIAHGYLTLSMLAGHLGGVVQVREVRMGVNYGLNKVRFVAPVRVGSRVRGAFVLASAKTKEDGSRTELVYDITVEIDGEDKPALIAQWIRVAMF